MTFFLIISLLVNVLLVALWLKARLRRNELEAQILAMIVSGRIKDEFDTGPYECPKCNNGSVDEHTKS